MSKFFEMNERIEFIYPNDMKKIISYLETMGTIRCTKKKIESLWEEFSEERCASWLGPDDEDLYDFANWLNDYPNPDD